MEFLLVGRVVQGAAGGLLAGPRLRGHQCRAAAVAVDQGVGTGVGDVGRWHADRAPPPGACSPNSVRGVGLSAFWHLDRR